MDQTRTNANRTTNSRSTYLPNITSTQGLSYSQRYEHMTKIANYNEMNENQIWKQYQKLRLCLKQLNQEVLYHMEKKAQNSLYAKQAPVTPTVQASLILLDQQRKTNQSRLQIFLNEGASLEQRVQHLTNKTQYLQDIKDQIEICQAKIKEMTLQNKDMRRKQKMTSKDLLAGASYLQKLLAEQQALHFARKKYDKYDQIYKQAMAKIQQFNQKTAQYQSVLQNRVSQYKQQEDYVAEEINLEKFQELQGIKTNLAKYESVYKRNYLMKLKQLEILVNSVNKQDQVIQQTQANILNMRGEIDQISAIVASNNQNRRRSAMSVMQSQSQANNGPKTARKSIVLDTSTNATTVKDNQNKIGSANDKNRTPPMRF